MPNVFFADLVREASHATGTGALALAGALPGHRSFAAVVPAAASFHYAIAGVTHPDQWEVGVGSLDSNGALVRGAIAASSSGGGAVNFAAGLKTVALTVGADWLSAVQNDAAALAGMVAGKQPVSTGHAATAAGLAGDLVTIQRGAGWFNLPLDMLVQRNASGQVAVRADGAGITTPLTLRNDAAGSAQAVRLAFASGVSVKSSIRAAVQGPDYMAFHVGNDVERMRIAANGNVGIGLNPDSRLHVGDSLAALRIGYLNTSQNFYDADTHWFRAGAGPILARITVAGIYPGGDNISALGLPSNRWSVVYAVTGTINTSDAREKSWRGELGDAELRAARRIAAEIGLYQWNDAIAEKGADKARIHVGVRAQAVWAIMADEGLVDPVDKDGVPGRTPYAFLCWDRWDGKEDGQAPGDRFGVRTDQLALFVAAAQEVRLTALEQAA
jgi:hypothetical protein